MAKQRDETKEMQLKILQKQMIYLQLINFLIDASCMIITMNIRLNVIGYCTFF